MSPSGPAQDQLLSSPYIVLALSGDGHDAARLDAILAALKPASLLLDLGSAEANDVPALAALVGTAQKAGVATLVSDAADLARIVKADGVHLSAAKDIAARYDAARESLGTRFIVGADAGRSRHDAMTLGEKGADYVAFGIPPHVEDRATARDRREDLVAWWSEIFEVPCVAFDVDDADDAAALASAGADFIAIRLPAGLATLEIGSFVARIAAGLSGPLSSAGRPVFGTTE